MSGVRVCFAEGRVLLRIENDDDTASEAELDPETADAIAATLHEAAELARLTAGSFPCPQGPPS